MFPIPGGGVPPSLGGLPIFSRGLPILGGARPPIQGVSPAPGRGRGAGARAPRQSTRTSSPQRTVAPGSLVTHSSSAGSSPSGGRSEGGPARKEPGRTHTSKATCAPCARCEPGSRKLGVGTALGHAHPAPPSPGTRPHRETPPSPYPHPLIRPPRRGTGPFKATCGGGLICIATPTRLRERLEAGGRGHR